MSIFSKKVGGSKVGNALRSVGNAVKTFAQTGSLKTALNSTKPALKATANPQQSANISKAGSSSFMQPKSTFGIPKQGQLNKQTSALRGSAPAPAPAGGLNFTPRPGSGMSYTAKPGGPLDGGPNYTPVPAGGFGSSNNFNNPLTAGGTTQDSYNGAPGMSTTSYSAPETANAGYTGTDKAAKQTAALDASAAAVAQKKDEATTSEEMDYWDQQQQKIQKQMNRLMQESQAEEDTQSQIDALANDERLVAAGLEQKTQDVNAEPIPMAYLQGWGTTFNKQANAKLQGIAATRVPLEVRLANLQQKRQSALDVVKSSYDEAKSRAKESRQRGYDLADYATKRKDDLYDKAHMPKTKSGSYSNADLSADSQALENSRGSDGYVDPTIYQQLYQAWVKNGGTVATFKSKFNPSNYVNPDNTWLPSYLMPAKSKSNSQSAF